MTGEMRYQFVFLHSGEPRARTPLFAGLGAPWEKLGPLVKRIVDGDVDSENCGSCWRPVDGRDDATAFLVQLGYDADGNWVNVKGYACCRSCSRLTNNELHRRLSALIKAQPHG
jgi:hypothetical protein